MDQHTKDWIAKCLDIYPLPWRVVEQSKRAMIVAANGAVFMSGINIGKADLIVEAVNAIRAKRKTKTDRLARVAGAPVDVLIAATESRSHKLSDKADAAPSQA